MPDISYSLIFYMWSGNSTRVQNKYSIMAIQSFDIWKSLHPLQLTVLKGSFTAYVRHKLLQRELKNGVEPSLKYNWQKRAAISWAGHFQRKENPSIWAVGFACKCQIHLLPVSLLLLKVSFKKVSAPFSSTSTVHKKKKCSFASHLIITIRTSGMIRSCCWGGEKLYLFLTYSSHRLKKRLLERLYIVTKTYLYRSVV